MPGFAGLHQRWQDAALAWGHKHHELRFLEQGVEAVFVPQHKPRERAQKLRRDRRCRGRGSLSGQLLVFLLFLLLPFGAGLLLWGNAEGFQLV